MTEQPQVGAALRPADLAQNVIRAWCGLMGALVFSLLPIGKWLFPGDSMGEMLGREAIWWCIALAIVLWLTMAERQPLRSIGFCRPTWKSVGFAVLGAGLVVAIFALQYAVILPWLHADANAAIAQQQAILKTPYWYRVLLVLRASVVEEILFRGYLIEKVRQLSGSVVLAIIVSVAAFTYAHLRGWGSAQLIAVGACGLVFSLLYIWRRDLPSNMLGHFLSDGLGFLTR